MNTSEESIEEFLCTKFLWDLEYYPMDYNCNVYLVLSLKCDRMMFPVNFSFAVKIPKYNISQL